MMTTTTPTATTTRRWAQGGLNTLAIGVAAYAVLVYGLMPLGALVSPAMRQSFLAHPLALYGHVFAAAVALLIGPWQFSARLRAARPALHRGLGRTYLVAVAIGGLCGLALAPHAQGGAIGQLGFACLAVAWLYSGLQAYRAIRAGRVEQHRRWMNYNHALTLAAVTLRLYLMVVLVAGFPFDTAYAVIAWLCWLPNLWVARTLPTMRRWHPTSPLPHQARSPHPPRSPHSPG